MALRKTSEHVETRLKALPTKPGCYIFKAEDGQVLYVGKALVLRNRVRSYFQASTKHSVRISRMVARVRDLEWIVVDSELEALVLECNLIKRHRPPYNVRLRDDKSYPYIVITREAFPRVIFARRATRSMGKCFGPFTSAYSVRETLAMLHKVFPLIPCGKSWSGEKQQRPCLYYHLNQCLAPCAGLADRKVYGEVLKNVTTLLEGKEDQLLDNLRDQMNQEAENLNFEQAAKLRDTIQSIETVQQRQKVVNDREADQDIVAMVKDERGAAVQMLYIRGGKLIGQRQFYLDGSADSAPGEAVQQFVTQYYADAPEVPKEVLLPVEIEERGIVQAWLRQKRGSTVTVEVPQGGEKLRLMEMAASNAEQALNMMALEMQQKEAWGETAMTELQESLGLPQLPARIEGYDISNIQGKAPVGSMVVCEMADAAKNEYRRFKVRYHPESPNDFAMMHEVITRRLLALKNGDAKFARVPDLIMIDGGKGQLSAALRARDELGFDIPMVGLAKRLELVIVPEGTPEPIELERMPNWEHYAYDGGSGDRYSYREVELPMNSGGLMLLRKLRDEAHRFALTYHRKLRDKRMSGSVLEEIPGIGPRRRRLLLRTFGSIEAMRRSSIEELTAVPTMTERLAKVLKQHLEDEEI